MKRNIFLLVLLAAIAMISGDQLSRASWIGRVGMTFFYKEYNFLKVWWQGAIAVFLFFIVMFWLHSRIQSAMRAGVSRLVHACILPICLLALYFTYDDFRHNMAHRLLGWHFHYGFYLVWVGWAVICIFYIFKSARKQALKDEGKTSEAIQKNR